MCIDKPRPYVKPESHDPPPRGRAWGEQHWSAQNRGRFPSILMHWASVILTASICKPSVARFDAPGLRREWRLNGTSRHILLIQRLNIGHADPTDRVTFRNSEVQ